MSHFNFNFRNHDGNADSPLHPQRTSGERAMSLGNLLFVYTPQQQSMLVATALPARLRDVA